MTWKTASTENEPTNRAIIAEEVMKAIQMVLPAILEQMKESTRKIIDDRVVIEKDKKQVEENILEIIDNEVLIEKEDLSQFLTEFNGVYDPIVAMTWIDGMENIFRAIQCADEDKVIYAVPMLRSEALNWWDMVKATRGPEATTNMTWIQFKEVFKEEFCPTSMAIELEDEFMTLKQGSQTMHQYTARFEELAWFVEHHLPPFENRKIYRFVQGLKPNIRDLVTKGNPTTFVEAVEAAKQIENYKNRQLDETRNNLKRKLVGLESQEGECSFGFKK